MFIGHIHVDCLRHRTETFHRNLWTQEFIGIYHVSQGHDEASEGARPDGWMERGIQTFNSHHLTGRLLKQSLPSSSR